MEIRRSPTCFLLLYGNFNFTVGRQIRGEKWTDSVLHY